MIPTWLTSPLAKFLLVVAVLCGVAWGISWGVHAIDENGYTRAESKYKLQIANDDEKRAETVRLAEAAAQAERDDQARNAIGLAERLMAAKGQIDVLNKRLQERAKNVSTLYRPQPDAALLPVPGWVVTHGWLCDYNRAIGYAMPEAGAAASGIESPSCAADPFGPSSVTGEQILVHHEEYGGYCRKLEEQVKALLDHIDFIEGHQNK
jgi:hypothetical protein